MRAAAAAGVLVISLAAGAAAAQEAAPPLCKAFKHPAESGGLSLLHVVCDEAGTSLGPIDDYAFVRLPSLRAAVAVTSLEGARRVWLIMSEGRRSLLVEEITGTIARAAGRGATGRIDNLQLDFGSRGTGQATGTLLAFRGRRAGEANGAIDLEPMVARARAARANAASARAE